MPTNGLGRLLTAAVNLLLAMNGEPEPLDTDLVEDIARRMDELAERVRRGYDSGYDSR